MLLVSSIWWAFVYALTCRFCSGDMILHLDYDAVEHPPLYSLLPRSTENTTQKRKNTSNIDCSKSRLRSAAALPPVGNFPWDTVPGTGARRLTNE